MSIQQRLSALLMLCMSLLTASCAVNPVTGRNEISLVSEFQERQIGAREYGPSQQSQGGEYVTDPALSAYVNSVGQRIAAVSDRPLDYEFTVLNNSVPNAWALPGGKIAVNRGLLLELNNEAELAAVLGHEVVHAAARHGAQAMTRGTLLEGVLSVGAFATRDKEYSNYIIDASRLGAQLINQKYGREAERESDYYGILYMVRAGYDPRAAISLQETFVRLSEGNNTNWIGGLFASHPPSGERVENNRDLVEELMPELRGQDLETGEARYQQAIASLKENREAYALFDEAGRAVADGDEDIALLNLEAAINMVPREARFFGLKGDILLDQSAYRDAIKAFNEAIDRDGNYFDYYLGRGVAYSRLGQRGNARTDLERSTELLPTAVAYNELGKMSQGENDFTAAKEYFQLASAGQGRVSQEATLSFIRLDIMDNPGNYIETENLVDSDGRIYVRIRNRTSLDFSQVGIRVSADLGDRVMSEQEALDSLAGNASVDIYSGLRFPAESPWSRDAVRVELTGARL